MKKDILILIISHGKLAEELFATAQMIAGKINGVHYFNFLKSMTFQDLEKKVLKFTKDNKKRDILIFTDLFGGSCFNTCCKVINMKNIKVFSGVNLGLLLEAIFLRNSLNLEDLAKTLNAKKNDTIVFVNNKLK